MAAFATSPKGNIANAIVQAVAPINLNTTFTPQDIVGTLANEVITAVGGSSVATSAAAGATIGAAVAGGMELRNQLAHGASLQTAMNKAAGSAVMGAAGGAIIGAGVGLASKAIFGD